MCVVNDYRKKKCIFLIKSKIIHVPFVRITRKFIMPYLSRDNLAVLHAECLIYFDRGLFKIPFCHINFFSRVADVFVLPWHSVLLLFFLVPLSLTLYSSKFFLFLFFVTKGIVHFSPAFIYTYIYFIYYSKHIFSSFSTAGFVM